MKITIYELLRLIKDGKAPKKIKYKNNIYEYDGETQNYCSPINMIWDFLIGEDIVALLNDEVKIIEEDKKISFEKIEELTCGTYDFETQTINLLIKNQKRLIDEINKIKENR